MSATFAPPLATPRPRAQDLAAVVSMARFFSTRSVMDTDSLYTGAEALFALLQEKRIPHVLVGGMALLFHADSRNTEAVGTHPERGHGGCIQNKVGMSLLSRSRNSVRAAASCSFE